MCIIATKRLILRPLQDTDACSIARLIRNFEVLRWLTSPPHPYTLGHATAFVAAQVGKRPDATERVCAVTLADGGDFAGIVSIDMREGGPNLGYWLGQSYWGRGLMGEAARALTVEFFAKSGNKMLQSGYISGNEASAAIQRRLGFEMVGIGQVRSPALEANVTVITTQLSRTRYETLKR